MCSMLYQDEKQRRVQDLTVQLLAAEINLTHFSARRGKDSPEYRESLQDFAKVWHLLKRNRSSSEFVHNRLLSKATS